VLAVLAVRLLITQMDQMVALQALLEAQPFPLLAVDMVRLEQALVVMVDQGAVVGILLVLQVVQVHQVKVMWVLVGL
jgi:hypothetical protein